MKKTYYVFDGQNASTGKPNKITGRMSYCGRVYAFETREEALEFVEDNEQSSAQCITVAGTKATIRKYCLGESVADFEYNLEMIPVMKKDGDSWVESWRLGE